MKQLMANPRFDIDIVKTFRDESGLPILYGRSKEHMDVTWGRIAFNIETLPLSSCQRERLKFLLGPRYRGIPKVTIICRQYLTYRQNIEKAVAIFEELILEALRAPNIDILSRRSPYRHDKMKLKLGKTKEERKARRLEIKQEKKEAIEFFEQHGHSKQYQKALDFFEKEAKLRAGIIEKTGDGDEYDEIYDIFQQMYKDDPDYKKEKEEKGITHEDLEPTLDEFIQAIKMRYVTK